MSHCRVCTAPTDTWLCEAHARELAGALGDLPGLVTDVVASVARQTRVYRTARPITIADEDWRGGDDALEPTPEVANLAATDLLDDARNTLTTWARHVAGSRGVELEPVRLLAGPTCPPHRHDFARGGCAHWVDDEEAKTVACRRLHCEHPTCRKIRADQQTGVAAQLAQWFLLRLNSIRLDEAADQIHADLTRLRDRLQRAVDRSPSRLYAGPCHADVEHVTSEDVDGTVYTRHHTRCQRDLYAPPNAKLIVCDGWRGDGQGCRTVHTWGSRKKWLQGEAEEALVPLSDIQGTFPKLFSHLTWPRRSTWWKWVRDGRITPRTIDHGGIELYRGGDAVELVAAEQARIRGNVVAARSKSRRMSA